MELQENIYSNYELMLKPFLSKIKNRLGDRNQQNLLDIIETNLQEMVAPFKKPVQSHDEPNLIRNSDSHHDKTGIFEQRNRNNP